MKKRIVYKYQCRGCNHETRHFSSGITFKMVCSTCNTLTTHVRGEKVPAKVPTAA